jgi:hypothetical protein
MFTRARPRPVRPRQVAGASCRERRPRRRGPRWYGIGASTVERGLRELRQASLIESRYVWRKTPLSKTGWTKDTRYRLLAPLGPLGTTGKGTPFEFLLGTTAASPSHQTDSDPEAPLPPHSSGDAT